MRPSFARFQGSIAPTGRITASATMKGVKAVSKKGACTLSFLPQSNSATNGQTVPTKTSSEATERSTLFITSALSRLTVENSPFASIAPARTAKSRKAPPTKKARMARM